MNGFRKFRSFFEFRRSRRNRATAQIGARPSPHSDRRLSHSLATSDALQHPSRYTANMHKNIARLVLLQFISMDERIDRRICILQ